MLTRGRSVSASYQAYNYRSYNNYVIYVLDTRVINAWFVRDDFRLPRTSTCRFTRPVARPATPPPPPQLPIPKILFHSLAWGPIKVTIPSSYGWKYAPLWLINHPRWRIQGGGDHPPPPPLELVPILKTYAKCAWPGPITPPPPWNVDDVTRAMSKGGGGGMSKSGGVFPFFGGRMTSRGQCRRGVLVNVQEWGRFSIFWRADDVTQTMSKGGVLVNVFTPPPPSENPVSAPV